MKLGAWEKLAAVLAALFIAAVIITAAVSNSGRGVKIMPDTKAGQTEIMTGSGEDEELSPGEIVNINTADANLLKKLPGIGDALAGRIVEYRQKNGAFKSPEDIMKVDGIGRGKYDGIKDHISL